MLVELSDRRAALFQKLNSIIAQRQGTVDLEVRQQQLAAEAEAARARARQAERAVEEAKRAAARLRASNASRRAAHQRACGELSGRRQEHMAHHPTLLRYQALTHSHVAAMLLSEQRAKLAVLLDTLPLRVAAIRSSAAMMGQGGGAGQGQGQGPAAAAAGPGAGGGAGGWGAQLQGQGRTAGAAAAAAAAAAVAAGGGAAGAAASPIQVTLCNLKLPDGASVSSLMVQQPEATSSALGYLLLLAELLSTYLGGPLLHEGSFQASTSVVWQQHSFWNRRPSSSNARLPLFMEEGAGGPGPGIGNPFPGLAARVRGPGGWGSSPPAAPPATIPSGSTQHHPQGTTAAAAASAASSGQSPSSSPFSMFSRAFSSGVSAGAGGAGGGGGPGGGGPGGGGVGGGTSYMPPVDEALLRQRHADLRLAYDMLLRSLACFVRDKVVSLGLQLPAGWGPLGWLAVLCSCLRRDPGTEALLAAAQQAVLMGGQGSGDLRVGAAAGPGGAAGGAGGGGGAIGGGPAGGGRGLGMEGDVGGGLHDHDDDDPVEVEEDGWDVVQAPFLPPPPSQPDEVEHWTRAMFTDANAAQGPGPGGVGGGGTGGGGGFAGGGVAVAAAAAAGRRLGLGGLGSSLGSFGSSLGGLGGVQGGPPTMTLERVKSIFGK